MSRRTLLCAPAKRSWKQAPPTRLYARGSATDRHSPGVLRTPRKCLPLPAVGEKEMMPSLRSGKVMPGLESLALPECHVGGNVYGDAKANDSATATGWHSVNTGAGAMYAMPRPSATVPARGQRRKAMKRHSRRTPARGQRRKRYETTLAAYSRTWAVAKML